MPILTTPPKRTTQLGDEKMKSTIRNQLTIGANLYHRRKYKGLSQQIVAEKAAITQSIISELEAGEYNPSIEVLTKIADALKISIEYLTKEHFNWRFLETLDYFIAHLPKVDMLKLMKLLYFTDFRYYEKNGVKFTGTNYLRRYA
ncbi:MAG: helix-turn-helix domain-containing protein [Candidatus Peribacteria bacterium]|jgi:transcriptional regulator with XRE-family HTH domain|nr:helix-turn-helix domain-containing protein [Candidatus Peribacteria bacterium]